MTEAQAQELGPTGRPLRVYPDPAPLSSHGPARIISMVNQKGGVGKTTSTINLGAALAECGRKVLLVDFDPQGALSAGFGANPHELDLTVYNVMMDRKVDIKDVILPTGVENIDLLPANIDLSAAEVQLVNEVAREQVLASALRKVRDEYDVILIDCQPSLGLLTVNALTASDGVIIPLICEFFAARRGPASGDDREGAGPPEPRPRGCWRAGYHVRCAHHPLQGSSGAHRGRFRRQGVRHRHQAHREVPGRIGVC